MDITITDVEVWERDGTSDVEEDVRQSVTTRTESSSSDSFIRAGFMQLSQKGTVSEQMPRKSSNRPSRRLERNNKRNSLSVGGEEGTESILKVTAEKDDILLQVSNYEVSKEDVERKPSE